MICNNNDTLTKQLKLNLGNEHLKEQIAMQNNKLADQANEIKLLKEKNEKHEERELYNRYMTAIQDANNKLKLETKIPSLSNLISDRITNCHYLDKTFNNNEIDQRMLMLNDKLTNMPNSIKKKFDKRYPGLIDSIVPYITSLVTTLTDDEEEQINEWWEC